MNVFFHGHQRFCKFSRCFVFPSDFRVPPCGFSISPVVFNFPGDFLNFPGDFPVSPVIFRESKLWIFLGIQTHPNSRFLLLFTMDNASKKVWMGRIQTHPNSSKLDFWRSRPEIHKIFAGVPRHIAVSLSIRCAEMYDSRFHRTSHVWSISVAPQPCLADSMWG